MSLLPPPEINPVSIKQIGDYILGEEIGSGAFGKVVLGKHILTEEKVAIKILDKMILNQTPEDYELVKKEISILKLVKHKYIVQLYEIMQTAQHIFIIMEYCEGKEILDYILTKNRLSELESLKYFQQLINCLFYLHSQNIAHRDVKIDNMLLDKNKDLKLIDFGLSTKYTDDNLLDQPCGTVVYAAPEVLEGKEYHGMLADVWSSGIVLFGMLSGFLPFSDKDDEVNKQLVIKGEINIPDFFSDMAKDLLKHMLDIDPMTRYTLQEIKDHPWFNMVECILIPGIIIDYNIIPVDEKILNLCVTYNKNKDEVFESVRNNKYDSNSSLYYLIIKKLKKKGFKSVSDLCCDEFIDYILDEKNLVHQEQINENEKNNNEIHENKNEEILIEYLNEENIDEKEEKKEIENRNENIDENEIKINSNNMINKETAVIELLEKDKESNILNEINYNKNEELKNKQIKLSDILNESYSQKSNRKDSNNNINIKNNSIKNFDENTNNYDNNKDNIDNNDNNKDNIDNNAHNKDNIDNIHNKDDNIDNDHNKIYIDNNDHNKVYIDNNNHNKDDNIDNNEHNKDNNKNDNIDYNDNNNMNNMNNLNNSPEKEEEKNILNENILITPEKRENKNKDEIIEKNIIEKEEMEIQEKSIENENEIDNEKYKDLNKRNLFEEMIIEEQNINKESEDINTQKEIYDKDNIKNKNEEKKEIIENIEINISEINENSLINNNNNNKDQISMNEGTENTKKIENLDESMKNNNDNKKQIIINSEIDLTAIDEMKNNLQINLTSNIEDELNKFNNNVNDIEVIDIKINKNEKYINLKNENKRYTKTNEKTNKSKIVQTKKKTSKNRKIYKTSKKKLYSIEKSNNVLNNLKKSQVKPNNNNPRISLGTDVKNIKNRSVFKMPNNQIINNKIENSFKNENIKKDSSKYINYSTRNTKKKLLFTKSKPESEFNKNFNAKKNHSNLKKKTSNQIFSIISIINKNNFISTTTDFKLKSFINSSSQNYKSTKKINKTNLQSKFDEMANDKNKDKKEEIDNNNVHLSLNKKLSNSRYNNSTTNKNSKNKYNSNKKNYINNYTSLLTQNKNGFNNINTINNNILKSIKRLDYDDKNNSKNINNLKNKKNSQNIQNKYNKSLSHNLNNKINGKNNKEQIINKEEEKNKMNKKTSKHLESSVIVNRYKSPIAIRELSESPKQKYLNIKTRYTRIPWKIKKKGIDEKLESNFVYKNFINRIMNPFNQNNSKIVNYNKYKKKNSIRKPNNYYKKKLNKTLWTTNIKQIKLVNNKNSINIYNKSSKNINKVNNNSSRTKIKFSKERFSSDIIQNKNQNDNKKNNNMVYTPNKNKNISIHNINNSNIKISNINSLYSTNYLMSNNKINETENKIKNENENISNTIKKTSDNQIMKDSGYFSNIKTRHKHSNSVSSMLSINLKNKLNINNDNKNIIYSPIDLSCLFIKYKSLNEYSNYLKNKFKKNNISYIQKKSNLFICNKNDINCEIEIIKLNNIYKDFTIKSKSGNIAENDNENIFKLRVYGRKERYRINEIFKTFIFNLD